MVLSVEDTRVSWLKDRGLLRGETHKTHAQCIKIVLEMISCTVWFIKSLYKPLFKYKNTIITLLDANTYIWCFPKPQSCSDGLFIVWCYVLSITILWIIFSISLAVYEWIERERVTDEDGCQTHAFLLGRCFRPHWVRWFLAVEGPGCCLVEVVLGNSVVVFKKLT